MKEMNLILYLFDGLSTQREISSDFKTEIWLYIPSGIYIKDLKKSKEILNHPDSNNTDTVILKLHWFLSVWVYT